MNAPRPIDMPSFISGYSSADEQFILFAWNSRHGDEFKDANAETRRAVREAVLVDLAAAPVELVRDLYKAETEYSREAWCIYEGVGLFAEQLLRRGGDRFIEDFLKGKGQSFDASLGSAFDFDLPLAEHLLRVVRDRLRSETDEGRIALLQFGERTFQDWVDDCRRG